ncbi:VapE family protein [Niabella terrae]
MQFDGKINIATGKSRKEINWKNIKSSWSKLVAKLENVHVTPETHATYIGSPKDRQDEIKDVGGFVGGRLQGGRRKSGSVINRTVLTLDLDFATMEFWDDFTLLFDNAAVLHTTHKHIEDKPRFRLVMPLSREVFPEEYEAIARKVAGHLDIELFDPTTFQPERLMYWPSIPSDVPYYFKFQDSAWLDVDAVLAEYTDWTDSSEWPVSDKIDKIVAKAAKTQGDPLEKKGVIGAFCRQYSIHDVLEKFLSDTYEPTDDDVRYSLIGGSTSKGLIVYEDKFAYSHHGSDTATQQLLNAFDLVRVHKYGLQDEDCGPDTKITAKPSYRAMMDFAAADPGVRKLLGEEKIREALAAFDSVIDETWEEENDWLDKLDSDKSNAYVSTVANIKIILEHDTRFKGLIANNLFTRKTNVLGPMPWDKADLKYPREWDDDDLDNLKTHLALDPYKLQSTNKVKEVLTGIRSANSFHPIKDYLQLLKWDGVERLDTVFIDYQGCQDSDYTRAVTRKTLTAAVARIYKPGCKFDYMPILIGDEGRKKSTIVNLLAGDTYFSDTFNFKMLNQGVRAYEQIQGKWIVEVPELAGKQDTDIELIKSFTAARMDNYRGAYGRETVDRPRQNIFIGTSNNYAPLRNVKGNRRFWPMEIDVQPLKKDIAMDLTQHEINQIWAEAVVRYKEGEKLYLDEELEAEARQVRRGHTEEDDRTGMVKEFLDKDLPADWYEMGFYEKQSYLNGSDPVEYETMFKRDKISAIEIAMECFGINRKDINRHSTKPFHALMQSMEGWRPSRSDLRIKGVGRVRGYIRIGSEYDIELQANDDENFDDI